MGLGKARKKIAKGMGKKGNGQKPKKGLQRGWERMGMEKARKKIAKGMEGAAGLSEVKR